MTIKQMTHREIAIKVLDVIDLREKSWVKTGIGVDRVGKEHEQGHYTKTDDQCFKEIFGDDSFLYESYKICCKLFTKEMKDWANYILKMV